MVYFCKEESTSFLCGQQSSYLFNVDEIIVTIDVHLRQVMG